MTGFILDHIICTGCLGFRYGPTHLFRKVVCGVDCDRS